MVSTHPTNPLGAHGLTKEKALDLLRQMWEIRRFEEAVYDLLGRSVATLFDEVAHAGRVYTMKFDASDVASGVYLYALTSGGRRDVKRLMVVK